jgi:hypothetical protein
MRHQLGAHRIQHHIPAKCEQVGVFFDEDRGEPSQEEMPDPMMPTVVRLRVAAIELAHAEREIGLRRFNEQMIVVIHQTVGVAKPPVPIDDVGQQRQPLRPITVIVHDVLPGIAPTRDVVDGSGEFETKRTRHDAAAYPSACSIERADPILSIAGQTTTKTTLQQ